MVKYYYIIGFTEPTELSEAPMAGHYMGKTSDLVFKTEPDKSIDLDDGSTEVGSEKLSVSFTTLGKLQNPWPLAELWLVPVTSDLEYVCGSPEIIQIDLRGCEYHLDAKSGDWEKILFSATLRYAAEQTPYHAIEDYFGSYSMVLGKLQGDMNGDEVRIQQDDILVASVPNDMMLVERCFAFVGIDQSIEPSVITFGDSMFDLYGVGGLIWFNPDGN